MSVTSIGMGTLGFLRVKGRVAISDEVVNWSIVVKVMDVEAEAQFEGAEGSFASQTREIDAYNSGFFDQVNGGLKPASCHGITQTGNVTMLWLEDLSDSVPHPWGKNEFLTSARNAGFFNGSWPESRAPDGAWFDRNFVTNRPNFFTGSEWLNSISAPENKLLVDELGERSGVAAINEMPVEFAEVAESTLGLPRVVSHNDLHSRNAFFRHDKHGPVTYVFDWASVGLGPVGIDGGTLAGGGLIWTEKEARLLADIEGQMFNEYLGGLAESGYDYKRDEVRLGYLSNFTIYMLIYVTASLKPRDSQSSKRLTKRFGVDAEQFSTQLALRLRMFKPLFDEVVALARQLG